MFPEARIIFLVNEKEAIPILKDSAECVWCHQNAFLDPDRYPLATGTRKFACIGGEGAESPSRGGALHSRDGVFQ